MTQSELFRWLVLAMVVFAASIIAGVMCSEGMLGAGL